MATAIYFYLITTTLWLYILWRLALVKRVSGRVEQITAVVTPFDEVKYDYAFKTSERTVQNWRLPDPRFLKKEEELIVFLHLVTGKIAYVLHANVRWWRWMIIAFLVFLPASLLLQWLSLIDSDTLIFANTIVILCLVILHIFQQRRRKNLLLKQSGVSTTGKVIEQKMNDNDAYFSKVIFTIADDRKIVTYVADYQRAIGEEVAVSYDPGFPHFIKVD